ncbi:hypothetical protein CAMGR0001_2237 [Campylobacter gracilis RM3268]|uniref:Uncharacterized protein n=1 Tax=Campylobacter gracilis RM3268 TaxID=553220 RepID=C8PH49_9BACT|nr:hypothetical protein CAMGR0001_2237 [Campylobacter gracilis RM3268]
MGSLQCETPGFGCSGLEQAHINSAAQANKRAFFILNPFKKIL